MLERLAGGRSRHHRRHASAAVEGRAVQGSGSSRRRRRAALRRGAQGTHQADAQAGRRADDDGDTHSANVEHVARRDPGHVDHRDAAEGSALDSDQRRQVRRSRHRAGHPERACDEAGRFTSSTIAWNRSSRSGTCFNVSCPRHEWPLVTARWAKRNWSGRCWDSSKDDSTSCWQRRSWRTVSIFPTRTRSSSTAPIAMVSHNSTNCADEWADRTVQPTRTS